MTRVPILMVALVVLLQAVVMANWQSPVDFTEREWLAYSKLTPEVQQNIASISDVVIDCYPGPLRDSLVLGLERVGLRIHSVGCKTCRAVLTVDKGKDRFWQVGSGTFLITGEGTWVVRSVTHRPSGNHYVDAEHSIRLTSPGQEQPLLLQNTVVVIAVAMESKLTDYFARSLELGPKPPNIPDAIDLSAELVPVIAGVLGKWEPLTAMLNDAKSSVRSEAIKLIREIGNPAATDMLKARLEKEKKRAVKKQLKKAIKELEKVQKGLN